MQKLIYCFNFGGKNHGNQKAKEVPSTHLQLPSPMSYKGEGRETLQAMIYGEAWKENPCFCLLDGTILV